MLLRAFQFQRTRRCSVRLQFAKAMRQTQTETQSWKFSMRSESSCTLSNVRCTSLEGIDLQFEINRPRETKRFSFQRLFQSTSIGDIRPTLTADCGAYFSFRSQNILSLREMMKTMTTSIYFCFYSLCDGKIGKSFHVECKLYER